MNCDSSVRISLYPRMEVPAAACSLATALSLLLCILIRGIERHMEEQSAGRTVLSVILSSDVPRMPLNVDGGTHKNAAPWA